MKNEPFMQWLMKNKIYLKEMIWTSSYILAMSVRMIVFIHTRAALNELHNQQLHSYLKGQDILAIKIKSRNAKAVMKE
jgi:hypothetical protein